MDIASELKHAQAELRAGSMDRAAEILVELEKALSASLAKTQAGSSNEKNARRALLKVLNNLGVVHKNMDRLDLATDALERALDHAVLMGDEGYRMQAGILSNLGLVYSRRRMYTRSLEVFDQALLIASEHPEHIEAELKVKLHNNRALFFVRFAQPDKAREELSLALEASGDLASGDENSENEREAWLSANLALVHVEIGEEEIIDLSRQEEFFRIARSMFLKSAQLYQSEEYLHHSLKQFLNAAEIEVRLGYLEDARRRLKWLRDEAERIQAGRLVCDIAQVEVELAMKSARDSDLAQSIKNAVDEFKHHKPVDMNSRIAKMEGMLRRGGKRKAVLLLENCLSKSGNTDEEKEENKPGKYPASGE